MCCSFARRHVRRTVNKRSEERPGGEMKRLTDTLNASYSSLCCINLAGTVRTVCSLRINVNTQTVLTVPDTAVTRLVYLYSVCTWHLLKLGASVALPPDRGRFVLWTAIKLERAPLFFSLAFLLEETPRVSKCGVGGKVDSRRRVVCCS